MNLINRFAGYGQLWKSCASRKIATIAIWFVVSSIVLAAPANGAFVDGVEQFNGTQLDLVTWELSFPDFNRVTQNNRLIIAPSARVDYTTRQITVGVGQRVSVEVTRESTFVNSVDGFGLMLTTNSTGVSDVSINDSKWLSLELGTFFNNPNVHFLGQNGNPQSASGQIFASTPAISFDVGIPYELEIQRASHDVAVFVARHNGLEIGRLQRDISGPNIQDDLYIALFFGNGGGHWSVDNVKISAIPEPSSCAILLTGMGVSLLRLTRPTWFRRKRQDLHPLRQSAIVSIKHKTMATKPSVISSHYWLS